MEVGRVAFAFAALIAAPSLAAELSGKPRVIDGDTLEIGSHRIRLFGADAPSEQQHCTRNGAPWACGREAAFAFAYLLAEHWVSCETQGDTTITPIAAVCRAGPLDLGEAMVRQGWARAARNESTRYVAAEEEARAARRGLWQGEQVRP